MNTETKVTTSVEPKTDGSANQVEKSSGPEPIAKQSGPETIVKESAPKQAPAELISVDPKIIADLQKQISDLQLVVKNSTDPRKLAEIANKNKKVLPICKISLWQDNVVMGWDNMSHNKVEIINGRESVDQRVVLLVRTPVTGADGERTYNIIRHEVDYVASFQNRTKEDVEIIKRTTDEAGGDVMLSVRRADGETLSISEKFVN